MSLTEKYQALLDIANQSGVANVSVSEADGVLTIAGSASESVKQRLWDAYAAIDPNMTDGDLVLAIETGGDSLEEYVVRPGDSLSKIAAHYGTNWQAILEANRDIVSDPDLIQIGWKLRIPRS
jgi:nucleoid-associated protein YgaU